MTFAILAAIAAALMSLALIAMRPEPRRLPVRIRDHDPRQRGDDPRQPPR
ncbi:MAG TPA: hypothetical protein VFJ13_12415 [Paracoccaceae bacterium]|nr:hypothetical protein [Paracoccaceae bacterium]